MKSIIKGNFGDASMARLDLGRAEHWGIMAWLL